MNFLSGKKLLHDCEKFPNTNKNTSHPSSYKEKKRRNIRAHFFWFQFKKLKENPSNPAVNAGKSEGVM
jgi:hypothetical protein